MRRHFGGLYLLECDAPSARAKPKQTSLTSAPLSFRKASRAFLYQATRNRQGAAKWSSRFHQNVQLRNRAPLPMSLPQALQLPPVHEALPAPTQQMSGQSRTAAGPGQHARAHPHNASALSPSLARIHYALHFAASTIPPYRCEKAYLHAPKSNAPNREPAIVSVHSLVFAVHPVFQESERSPVTRSATN